jgi:hypothetical protein
MPIESTVQTITLSPMQINASGTVFFAGNPVICTLEPIDSTGALRTGMGLPPPQANAATVAGTTWNVVFRPLAGMYNGLYLLTANAVNEGPSSQSGTVTGP